MFFLLNVIILIVTALVVGICFYIIGHVHGFEKGETETINKTNFRFDEIVFDYCPECKKVERKDRSLVTEVIQ